MPDTTIERLFTMLEAQAKLASKERHELTQAFERQLTGLRWELRGISITAAILILALSGVGVRLLAPGVSVTTTVPATASVENTEPGGPIQPAAATTSAM
jgi:hypothetical protein